MQRRKTAETGVEDFLANREGQITADVLKSAASVHASRDRFTSGVGNLAEETAGRYGLQPDIREAAAAQVQPISKDLERANVEGLELQKLRARREKVNQTYGFMFDRLLNAGVDRQQAEAVATQFATDEDARSFDSEQAQKEREHKVKQQDIADEYADRQILMERQAAQEQRRRAERSAIIKSLFGLTTSVGLGFALRGKGVK